MAVGEGAAESAVGAAGEDEKISFDYLKSQFFRVVHADGAIGGITPSGYIHFSFYSERQAIPQRQTFTLNEDGSLGQSIAEKTIIRNAVVRELDVDVVMNVDVARSLAIWLSQQVKLYEEKVEEARQGQVVS
ncbi:MAG: hypothetical protein INF81_12090 [Roseomonas sp.]|nr:hypothetical protein [Roseomonas sp.]MCA3431074.1 hypothetical protein [Roseomonas sp.]MCA3434345.1 hypothetical protein [Roseomonas sp.]